MKIIALTLVTAGLTLAGCAESPLQADYGQSVQQLTYNQAYDPRTLQSPSIAAVEGADPDMINAAVNAMRTQVGDRKEVRKPGLIGIGEQGGP